jgi:hypothetical protein
MPALNNKKKTGSHLRIDVETAALPVGLGGEVRHQLGVLVERHVLDYKHALLANSINIQGIGDRRPRTARHTAERGEYTLASASRRGTFLVLRIFEVLLGGLEVRNGESPTDSIATGGY